MKKIVLSLLLLTITYSYSQEAAIEGFKQNEIKGNALFLVIGAAEITYERLLNEDSGVGVSLFFAKGNDFDTNFSLTPYYRAYFGKKVASGFFVEGFSMFNTGTNGTYTNGTYNYNTQSYDYVTIKGSNYTDLALGFGLGAKWVQKRGYVFELNAGIGRNLLNSDSPEIVGRGGLTIGYRF